MIAPTRRISPIASTTEASTVICGPNLVSKVWDIILTCIISKWAILSTGSGASSLKKTVSLVTNYQMKLDD